MAVAGVDEDNNGNNDDISSSSNGGRPSANDGGTGSLPPPEELLIEAQYESKIDWDAEWKKVKKNQGQPAERPGKNFYKSEAELAAIRAANRAASELNRKQASFLSSVPSFDSLKGDWKFWVGVLLVISFGTSFLSAVSGPSSLPPASISSPDSYFV